MHTKLLSFFTGILLLALGANAQNTGYQGWHLLDVRQDSFNGISLNKAYNLLKGLKSNPVVVAVIDTGVDTTQEDLKNVLWRNRREIPGNGIDDDNNGYIDDVYGWNFLGGKDGRNVKKESFEVSRVYHKYKNKYFQKLVDMDTMCHKTREEYTLWQKAAKELETKPEEQVNLIYLEMAYKSARKNDRILKEEMQAEEYTAGLVEKFQPATTRGKQAKMGYLKFLRIADFEPEETNKTIFEQLEEYIESKKKNELAKAVVPPDVRAEIIGDNYNDINDRFYGNSDVMGPAPMHGTHVAGIIGAQRNNGLGVDGIADNVKIMTIRALPDGDEYDKDVALAIRYAVDNGAKVINMSFGKGFSPEKVWVDEAVKYAETKDVLLVHAAGNEGENIDEKENYPNPTLKAFNNTRAANFITVGASSDPRLTGTLVADFSNYGRNSVNVFAPGVKIYSTLPGGDKYGFLKGTSMASPVVAGLAALIRSYYPTLTARQVKYALENSVTAPDSTLMVPQPGTKKNVAYYTLCDAGGIINAYGAVKLAAQLVGQPKEVKRESLPPSTFKNKKISQ